MLIESAADLRRELNGQVEAAADALQTLQTLGTTESYEPGDRVQWVAALGAISTARVKFDEAAKELHHKLKAYDEMLADLEQEAVEKPGKEKGSVCFRVSHSVADALAPLFAQRRASSMIRETALGLSFQQVAELDLTMDRVTRVRKVRIHDDTLERYAASLQIPLPTLLRAAATHLARQQDQRLQVH